MNVKTYISKPCSLNWRQTVNERFNKMKTDLHYDYPNWFQEKKLDPCEHAPFVGNLIFHLIRIYQDASLLTTNDWIGLAYKAAEESITKNMGASVDSITFPPISEIETIIENSNVIDHINDFGLVHNEAKWITDGKIKIVLNKAPIIDEAKYDIIIGNTIYLINNSSTLTFKKNYLYELLIDYFLLVKNKHPQASEIKYVGVYNPFFNQEFRIDIVKLYGDENRLKLALNTFYDELFIPADMDRDSYLEELAKPIAKTNEEGLQDNLDGFLILATKLAKAQPPLQETIFEELKVLKREINQNISRILTIKKIRIKQMDVGVSLYKTRIDHEIYLLNKEAGTTLCMNNIISHIEVMKQGIIKDQPITEIVQLKHELFYYFKKMRTFRNKVK